MHFLINAGPIRSPRAEEYRMGVCAIGLRVASARRAFERAIELGAWAFEGEKVGVGELKIPAIQGIGDSHLYFVDRWRGRDGQRGGVGDISIFDIDFRPIDIATAHTDLDCVGVGLQQVDHFTQTVGAGACRSGWISTTTCCIFARSTKSTRTGMCRRNRA